ncbi:MAG: hypothetical protein KKD63_12360 [Proteobacteria bacterium]|nr:hypothetical protein [Desulfobulbaceae bacterium]MBU4153663.1 hypothetical protein [Pseudomonadota bacterium]
MEQQQRQQIKKYIDLIVRRNRIIISCALVGIVIGLGVYLKMPKVYESTALLIYQRAKIDSGNKATLRPGDVATEIQEMVATLSQQVTSRTSLEAMVKQFSLYPEMLQKLPMEDVVDLMRKRDISINVGSKGQGDVFRVSYAGSNPKKVSQVANALAARFIEENLRYREERASETSAYVGDELELSKKNLDQKEEIMRDYKLKYYNEMPQQFDANSARLIALQTQFQSNRNSIQDLARTKVLIQEQITLRKEALSQMNYISSRQGEAVKQNGAMVGGPLAELAQARQQLADLQLRYTETHPEVKRMQKKVTALEESSAGLAQGAGTEAAGGTGVSQGAMIRDNQIDELILQFKKVDLDIMSLNQESEGLKKQIAQYEQWLSMTPVREAEWTALTRDYQQLSENYQKLVARNLDAGAAESLERRQKGSQFKIVDSAYLPEKPTRPDFKKIMLMALGVGVGVGCALAFLLEMRDSSFRDVSEIESYLQLPVVCAIPLVENDMDIRAKRRKAILWWTLVAVLLLGILGGMAYLYKTGRIIV